MRRSKRLVLGAAAAGLTALALLLGGAFRGSSSSATPVPPASPVAFRGLGTGAAAGGATAAQVVALQAAVRRNPGDLSSLDALGLAYQQRARETGDPTYYTKSQQVLDGALRLAPRDLVATSGLGSLALSRHRFAEALALGRRARAISPTTARNYGVIGDALVELGRYRAGFRAFDTMASLQPGLASYARVAHARYLLGDTRGAIAAERAAVDAALGQGEAEAWAHVELGKILWSVGRVAETGAEDRAALRAFPGYPYALDALAHVQAAQGRWRTAIATEAAAVDRIPLPQYVSALGDLYRASGNERAARKQYALVEVIRRLLAANGVNTDLEIALFDVDHAIRLPAALALARRAQAERPSIDGDDVLAWALVRTGRCGEALRFSKRALRLGTHDALKVFHRGMAERCLGRPAEARAWFRRALRLNPHFSIVWAPVARRLVR